MLHRHVTTMMILGSTLVALAALAAQKALLLDKLSPGDMLTARVEAHHKTKLFLSVPVERSAGQGAPKPVTAYMPLPPWHPLLEEPESVIGQSLTCYVIKPQPGAARLSVSLYPPGQPPRLATRRRREQEAADWPFLEDLQVGSRLEASVSSVQPCGTFVEVNVSRTGRGGLRRPMDAALLPADQIPPSMGQLVVGQVVELLVLKPVPAQGRVLLTALPLDEAALRAQTSSRKKVRKRRSRRPSLASLARTPGAQREGVVVRVEPYGVVVDVGARQTGLIHISQLDFARSRGGGDGDSGGAYVKDPLDVCAVGDQVLVKVLQKSSASRLRLRLVKIFPRDEAEAREQLATLRRDESLQPRYTRAGDGSLAGASSVDATVDPVEEDNAWGAYEAAQEQEEDAWAAYETAQQEQQQQQPSPQDADEEEDPFAWAAADASASEEVIAEEKEEGEEEDGPNFDSEYFNEKYDVDYY